MVADAFSDASYLKHMLAFERAWTEALIASGANDGQEALAAIDGFVPDLDALRLGSETDGLPVPELVRQLKRGMSAGAMVAIHKGATSQDVIDTAMVLICRDVLLDFHRRATGIVAQLDALDARFGEVEMMGRTRMQAALPIRVSDRVRTWRAPLHAHLEALPILLGAFARVQVGGPVGVRGDDTITAHVAKTLNLSLTPVWHTDRSGFVNVGNWLVLLGGTLGKIGLDISLMAQQGIDEVKLSGAGGSSAMPHKQNPVRAETLVTLARYVAGKQGILGQAMLHEQERSGAAWTLEWMVLPEMFEATGAALNSASGLLGQIERLGRSDD